MPRAKSLKTHPSSLSVKIDMSRLRKRKSDSDVPSSLTLRSSMIPENRPKEESPKMVKTTTRSKRKEKKEKGEKLNVNAEEEVERLRKKCSELEGRLMESHQALHESRSHNEDLEKIHEEKILKVREEYETALAQLQEKVKMSEKTILKLELEVTERTAQQEKQAQDAIEKMNNLEMQRLDEKKKLEEEIEKVKEHNKFCCGTIKDLEKKVEHAEQGRDNLVLHLKKIEAEHKEQLESLNEEHKNTVHEKILKLQSKIAEHENALQKKEKLLIQITKEKEESERGLKNTIKGMEDIVTIVKKQNEDVAQKLLKERKKIEVYETLKKNLDLEMTSLRDE